MLVRGKCLKAGGGRPPPAFNKTTLSQQIDVKKEGDLALGEGQGEGKSKIITLKKLDVVE